MEFLRGVEEDLRTLSSEARKKHAAVKDASERGVLRLRRMREEYARSMRVESAPSTRMFQSQDLLRPFLLACNHADAHAKLVSISIGAIQRLIHKDAIATEDVPNLTRVLLIQAERDPSVKAGLSAVEAASLEQSHLRILQTLLLLLTPRSYSIDESALATALGICFRLNTAPSSSAVIVGTAAATARQLVAHVFDVAAATPQISGGGGVSLAGGAGNSPRVAVEPQSPRDGKDGGAAASTHVPSETQESKASLPQAALAAYWLFQDLCLLSLGERAVWLRQGLDAGTVPRELGLELVESVLLQASRLFVERPPFGAIVRRQLCPLLSDALGAASIAASLASGADDSGGGVLGGSVAALNLSPAVVEASRFPLVLRLVRCSTTLLCTLGHSRRMWAQLEPLLATLLHCLGGGSGQGTAFASAAAAQAQAAAEAKALPPASRQSFGTRLLAGAAGLVSGSGSTSSSSATPAEAGRVAVLAAAEARAASAAATAAASAGHSRGAGGPGGGWLVELTLESLHEVTARSSVLSALFEYGLEGADEEAEVGMAGAGEREAEATEASAGAMAAHAPRPPPLVSKNHAVVVEVVAQLAETREEKEETRTWTERQPSMWEQGFVAFEMIAGGAMVEDEDGELWNAPAGDATAAGAGIEPDARTAIDQQFGVLVALLHRFESKEWVCWTERWAKEVRLVLEEVLSNPAASGAAVVAAVQAASTPEAEAKAEAEAVAAARAAATARSHVMARSNASTALAKAKAQAGAQAEVQAAAEAQAQARAKAEAQAQAKVEAEAEAMAVARAAAEGEAAVEAKAKAEVKAKAEAKAQAEAEAEAGAKVEAEAQCQSQSQSQAEEQKQGQKQQVTPPPMPVEALPGEMARLQQELSQARGVIQAAAQLCSAARRALMRGAPEEQQRLPRHVAMGDDDLDMGLLAREGLINLLGEHAAVGGAGASASEDPEPGSLAACEKAWVGTWALPESCRTEALQMSRHVWPDGIPAAVQVSAAWQAAARAVARAMAEDEGESENEVADGGEAEVECKAGREGQDIPFSSPGGKDSKSESSTGSSGYSLRKRQGQSLKKWDISAAALEPQHAVVKTLRTLREEKKDEEEEIKEVDKEEDDDEDADNNENSCKHVAPVGLSGGKVIKKGDWGDARANQCSSASVVERGI
eukprot:g2507.t1